MLKSTLLILFLIILFLKVTGQSTPLVLTSTQNNKWLDSLSKSSLIMQLKMIENRLLSDTNVFERNYYNDRITVSEALGSRVYGEGKPVLFVDQYPLFTKNNSLNTQVISLARLINTDIIKKITILKATDPATAAIFGSEGRSGVIILNLQKKKYLQKFKKIKL